MSGGHFNYSQHAITEIAEEIERAIQNNEREDEYGWGFSGETISRLCLAVNALEVAAIFAHRADWLLSGDDGEEAFNRRLIEDLGKLARGEKS